MLGRVGAVGVGDQDPRVARLGHAGLDRRAVAAVDLVLHEAQVLALERPDHLDGAVLRAVVDDQHLVRDLAELAREQLQQLGQHRRRTALLVVRRDDDADAGRRLGRRVRRAVRRRLVRGDSGSSIMPPDAGAPGGAFPHPRDTCRIPQRRGATTTRLSRRQTARHNPPARGAPGGRRACRPSPAPTPAPTPDHGRARTEPHAPRNGPAWRLAPAIFVVALALALVWPAPIGKMPLSQDHTVHLARAWMFGELLETGHVLGWSSYWYFGFPLGELYPVTWRHPVLAPACALVGLLPWPSCTRSTFTIGYVVQGRRWCGRTGARPRCGARGDRRSALVPRSRRAARGRLVVHGALRRVAAAGGVLAGLVGVRRGRIDAAVGRRGIWRRASWCCRRCCWASRCSATRSRCR